MKKIVVIPVKLNSSRLPNKVLHDLNGYKIKMIKTNYNSIGIDTMEDNEKALELLT